MILKLIEKRDESPNVKSFFWEPSEEVVYTPGQYFYYTLPKLNYEDARGETRHFTISSSPTEGKILRLTTKFPNPTSGYKKTLDELPIGAEINGRGPQGTFTLDIESKDIKILIAGGIGITPFRSMIKYNYNKGLNLPLYLIYSNSDENFIFGDELKEMLSDKVEFVNTSKDGHLDKSKIIELLGIWHLAFDIPTFWLVGPPPFVDGIEESLEKLNVVGDKILTEKFTGY